ncbi:MAG: cyclic nucleotide-binding/CBS domain-containing protein, partial [Aquifex sp.]
MIGDVKEFLKTHYPFSSLPPSSLENLSRAIKVKYYPKGSGIFKKGKEPLKYLYVIRKGNVSLKADGTEIDFLSEGDSFGFISLLTDSPPSSTAVAETDVILYLIPKEVFKHLMEKYKEFRDYFTLSLARRIAHTAERVKERGRSKTFEKFLTVQVKDLKLRKVPFVSPDENVYKAVKKMVETDSSCAIVKSDREEGIITERDVIKKVIYRDINLKEVKVKEVMTT